MPQGSPAIAKAPAPSIIVPQSGGAPAAPIAVASPLTREDVRTLRDRRSQLSDQLSSASNRRAELVEQLAGSEGTVRKGLEDRIQFLDGRILQIEKDISENGRLLASAPGSALSGSGPATPGFPGNMDTTAVSVVFTIFVLMPISVAWARRLWKKPEIPPGLRIPDKLGERVEQLQQSLDAIAVEMERVSEGQRFVTKILAEREKAPVLNAGAAPMQPLKVPLGDAVRVEPGSR
ncbi:MAG: hypothetical protein K2X99_03665 [Gemmatimonadaceae bacterium]|nr:hypothetical protein [Gemmatimonadaceae bacterium]